MNAKIHLKRNEERRIKTGHPWAFSNEIIDTDGEPQNGDLVELYDYKNNFLGTGFYNKNSLIAVRMLTNEKIIDLRELFNRRLTTAFSLRKSLYPERESFRLVLGESDFLPGLSEINTTIHMSCRFIRSGSKRI